MRLGAVAVLVGVTVLPGCADPEPAEVSAAAAACSQLDEASTPIARRVVESDLLASLEDDDDLDAATLFAELVEQCPEHARTMLGISAGGHIGDIELVVDECTRRETTGTVRNDGEERLRIRVTTRVLDEDDTLLDTGTATIDGLEPGQTGTWRALHLVDVVGVTCHARVDQAIAQ